MQKIKRKTRARIKEFEDKYQPDDSIWSMEGEQLNYLKHIVMNLPRAKHNLLLLYAELGSFRKVGKELGVSAGTVRKEIKKIQEMIFEEYGLDKFNITPVHSGATD